MPERVSLMRPSRRLVQGVRLRDHQGRDGPRRRSLLRVVAVVRTFWKHTNSKNFLFLHLPPLTGAPRLVHCGPYTMACSAPLRRGTSAERLVEVATEAQRHRWPGAAPLAP